MQDQTLPVRVPVFASMPDLLSPRGQECKPRYQAPYSVDNQLKAHHVSQRLTEETLLSDFYQLSCGPMTQVCLPKDIQTARASKMLDAALEGAWSGVTASGLRGLASTRFGETLAQTSAGAVAVRDVDQERSQECPRSTEIPLPESLISKPKPQEGHAAAGPGRTRVPLAELHATLAVLESTRSEGGGRPGLAQRPLRRQLQAQVHQRPPAGAERGAAKAGGGLRPPVPDAPAYLPLHSTPPWQCSSQPAARTGGAWAWHSERSVDSFKPKFISTTLTCSALSPSAPTTSPTSPEQTDEEDFTASQTGSSSDNSEESEEMKVSPTHIGHGKAGIDTSVPVKSYQEANVSVPLGLLAMPLPEAHAQLLPAAECTGTETTLLVRRLSPRTTPEDLLNLLPLDGSIDFVHIPYNVKQRRRTRYAFINFTSHAAAQLFIARWSGRPLPAESKSGPPVELGFAVVQGLRANAEHHKCLARVREAYRPIVFRGRRRILFRQLLQELGIME